MNSSEELLLRALEGWSSVFGRKLTPKAIEWWTRLFGDETFSILEKALDIVARNCERLPTPGHLTKALTQVKDSIPAPPSTLYSYRKIVAKDEETGAMVDAIVYDHDPGVVNYRATDCREGREFLNVLAKWKGKQAPFPALRSDEDARVERNRQKAAWIEMALAQP